MSKNRALSTAALLLALPALAGAQGPVRLTDGQQVYAVGSHLEILTAQEEARTIDDVAAPAMDGAFTANPTTRVGLAPSAAGHWTRLRLVDESAPGTRWLLSIRGSQVAYLDLYTPAANGGGFEVWRTGAALPFASRQVPDRRFVFRLPPHTGGPASYAVYLRLASDGPIVFEPTILSSEAFALRRQEALFGLGLFHGAMLVAIVGHLCIFLIVRDPSYLWYSVFISVCVLGLARAEGLLEQLVWPQDRVLPPETMLFLMGLFVPSALAFGASFLRTRRYLPRVHKWIGILLAAAAVWLVVFPFVPAGAAAQVFRLLAVLATLTVAGAGLAVWRKGHRPARYFSIAWLVFIAIFLVVVSGARPSAAESRIDVAYVGLHVSVALTTLVFALALADGLRWQREQTRAEREELIRELEARNAELGRFAYSVSHDLAAPRAVPGPWHALRDDGRPSSAPVKTSNLPPLASQAVQIVLEIRVAIAVRVEGTV